MASDIWHKIDSGSFERDKTEFDYVLEQNNGKPIDDPKNIRIRVTKQKPVITKVRTRYDPQMQAFGDANAAAPTWLGYDMKMLKPNIILLAMILWVMFLTVDMLLLNGMLSKSFSLWFSSWSQLTIGTIEIPIAGYILKYLMAFMFIGMFCVPILYRTFKKWQMYKRLKKEGLDYSIVEALQGGN